MKKTIKKSKFNNIKKNGYASIKEANRATVLKILEKNGTIEDLKEQVTFILAPKQFGLNFKGKNIVLRRELKYIADFQYINSRTELIIEDVKGFKTLVYKRKKRMMKEIFGIIILET